MTTGCSGDRTEQLPGFFVSFEGIDRSGKSTQAALLAAAVGEEAILVREPGGTPAAERIRSVLLDPDLSLAAEAEALLYAAARAEIVGRVILPALEAGHTVVADRFIDSSLAYQGCARGLGIDVIERLNLLGTRGLWPNLTFYLKLDPEAARIRDGQADRIEAEGADLQSAVAAAYEELQKRYQGRYVVLDATQPVDELQVEILSVFNERRRNA